MMSEAFEAVIRMGNPGFPLLCARHGCTNKAPGAKLHACDILMGLVTGTPIQRRVPAAAGWLAGWGCYVGG